MKQDGLDSQQERDEWIPTRKSLLSRLRDWGDEDSWQDFFETYWKLIYSAAVKAGLSDAEAQDVVQETVISVSKSMKKFRYNSETGSFKAWLLKLTRWRVIDQMRRRQRDPVVSGLQRNDPRATDPMESIPDPKIEALEAAWDQEWEKNLVDAAINRVRKRVDPHQFQVFDLYVLKQWPPSRIVLTLQVSKGQVYLAKYRIGRLIRKEVIRLREELT